MRVRLNLIAALVCLPSFSFGAVYASDTLTILENKKSIQRPIFIISYHLRDTTNSVGPTLRNEICCANGTFELGQHYGGKLTFYKTSEPLLSFYEWTQKNGFKRRVCSKEETAKIKSAIRKMRRAINAPDWQDLSWKEMKAKTREEQCKFTAEIVKKEDEFLRNKGADPSCKDSSLAHCKYWEYIENQKKKALYSRDIVIPEPQDKKSYGSGFSTIYGSPRFFTIDVKKGSKVENSAKSR